MAGRWLAVFRPLPWAPLPLVARAGALPPPPPAVAFGFGLLFALAWRGGFSPLLGGGLLAPRSFFAPPPLPVLACPFVFPLLVSLLVLSFSSLSLRFPLLLLRSRPLLH